MNTITYRVIGMTSHIYTHADNHEYLPYILLLLFKNCIKLR